MSAFQKATKKQAKLRLALEGPAGYGKTYTALSIARELVEPGQRVAYVDTEARSASKYAHLFDFDVVEVEPPFHPDRISEYIADAVDAGYGVVVVDSLSHFWQGTGGMLDFIKEIARVKYKGDTHSAWRDGDEIERRMKDSILRSPVHLIACLRMKTDTVREEYQDGERTRTRIRKAGMKVIQREDLDYEFDLVGQFDIPTVLTVVKTRVDTLPPETIIDKPGVDFADTLKQWLADGDPIAYATEEQLLKIEELCDALAKAREADVRDVRRALATEIGATSVSSFTEEQAVVAIAAAEQWQEKLNGSANGAAGTTKRQEASS